MHSDIHRVAAAWLLALAVPVIAADAPDPLAALARLDADAVYAAAIAANPHLAARDAAVRAAAQRPRQAAALPDPVASYDISPWTLGRGRGEPSHVATLSQAIPWPSARGGRIDAALALADAAGADADEDRRAVLLASRTLTADYWLAVRTADLQRRQRESLARLQSAAEAA